MEMPVENQLPDFEDDEVEEEKQDPTALAGLVAELSARCKAAGIPMEERYLSDNERFFTISLPSGREQRTISVFEMRGVQRLLEIPFESYMFLDDYAAICSYQDDTIEAAIRVIDTRFPRSKLNTLFSQDTAQHPEDGKTISMGPGSKELAVLARGAGTRPLALRIQGFHITQHDQAVEVLEKVANSIFFQIDVTLDVAMSLLRQRRPQRRGMGLYRRGDAIDLEFPRYEYDAAPMALYWYARGAQGMPLLQFLAFYQSIEFYFPTYAEAEARRRIKHLLKQPGFRYERDADIGKILTSMKSGGGWGLSDERSQLKATLQECISPETLRAFFEAKEDRKGFFSSKTKGLTDVKIPINNTSADLRNDVAERLYDIRCKIVHTKNIGFSEESEILLPFSKEAELLAFDVELIQFIARNVIIAASTPF